MICTMIATWAGLTQFQTIMHLLCFQISPAVDMRVPNCLLARLSMAFVDSGQRDLIIYRCVSTQPGSPDVLLYMMLELVTCI